MLGPMKGYGISSVGESQIISEFLEQQPEVREIFNIFRTMTKGKILVTNNDNDNKSHQ